MSVSVAAMAAVTAVSTIASAGMSIMAGQQQAEIAEAQAKAQQQRANFQADQMEKQAEVTDQQAEEYDRAAEVAETEAMQAENQRRDRLRRALSAQTAAAAAQGLSLGAGGSLQAIKDDSRRAYERDVTNIRFMGANKKRKLQLSGANTRQSAENARLSARMNRAYGQTAVNIGAAQANAARTQGYMQAGQTVLSNAFTGYQLLGGGSPSQTPLAQAQNMGVAANTPRRF